MRGENLLEILSQASLTWCRFAKQFCYTQSVHLPIFSPVIENTQHLLLPLPTFLSGSGEIFHVSEKCCMGCYVCVWLIYPKAQVIISS